MFISLFAMNFEIICEIYEQMFISDCKERTLKTSGNMRFTSSTMKIAWELLNHRPALTRKINKIPFSIAKNHHTKKFATAVDN